MIAWTSHQLGSKARSFFAELPLVLKGSNFRCAHGGFRDPAVFDYVETPEEALESFQAVDEQILFCGHSHNAGLFVIGDSGTAHWIEPQDFIIEENKRYIVNVGSVGSPRDGNPRASYVVFDETAQSIEFHRTSYDFGAFKVAAAKAGLTADVVPMLRSRAVSGTSSVREALDFSPETGQRAEAKVVETDVTTLIKKSTAKWKWLTLAAVCLSVAITIIAIYIYTQKKPTVVVGQIPVAYPPKRVAPASGISLTGTDSNWLPVFSPRLDAYGDFNSEPYRVLLEDSRYQSVESHHIPGRHGLCIVLKSENMYANTVLEAPDLRCPSGTKLEVISKAAFSDDFSGALAVSVWLLRKNANNELVQDQLLKTSNYQNQVGLRDVNLPAVLRGLPNSRGWWIARGTTDTLPGNDSFVRITVSGNFKGTVTIAGISARPK
jgi:diadenosine tetraphosphatase ApaH/serine/threonine PP2A family protein phosphatase